MQNVPVSAACRRPRGVWSAEPSRLSLFKTLPSHRRSHAPTEAPMTPQRSPDPQNTQRCWSAPINGAAGFVALPDQACQHGFDSAQIGHLFTDVVELALPQRARFAAMRAVVERQQARDLVEAEPQALRRLDEPDSRHVRLAVAADAATGLALSNSANFPSTTSPRSMGSALRSAAWRHFCAGTIRSAG